MALADQTIVKLPNGETEIGSIAVGDVVLAAGIDLNWAPTEVTHSHGSGEGIHQHAIYMRFEDQSGDRDLIVTRRQVFLTNSTRGAKMAVPAEALSPGDNLLSFEGRMLRIIFISAGAFNGRFHTIGMSKELPKPDIEEHFYIANGVVVGDFHFEIQLDLSGQSGCFLLPFSRAIV